jgi:membrane protein implicated in regulation of membrane protease activity
MPLSPIGWILWFLAIVGIAVLWFGPNLSALWYGLSLLAAGGFTLYLGDHSWKTICLIVLGFGVIAYWWLDRNRKLKTMKEQLDSMGQSDEPHKE